MQNKNFCNNPLLKVTSKKKTKIRLPRYFKFLESRSSYFKVGKSRNLDKIITLKPC